MRGFVYAGALGALLAGSSFTWAVNPTSGFYDEQTVQTNKVDFTAAGSSLTVDRFSARVREAYLHDFGGVMDGTNGVAIINSFGSSNTKSLSMIWSNNQPFTTAAPATAISGTAVWGTGAKDVNFDINPVIAGGSANEHVVEVGLTLLSQGSSFGAATVKAYLEDFTTNISATRTIADAAGAGDTFYGFTAPAGHYITEVQITHNHPSLQRISFDDVGFRTALLAPLRSTKITAVDAAAVMNTGTPVINDGATTVNVRNISANDRTNGVLEFDISNIPLGSTISSAMLELDLFQFTPSTPNILSVLGYAGDGAATVADGNRTGPILATKTIENTGAIAISLDAAAVQALLGNSHLGLLLSENSGFQMSFNTLENTLASFKPTLTIDYTGPVPEPTALSLIALASLALLRRSRP